MLHSGVMWLEGNTMQRITISVGDKLSADLESIRAQRGYQTRSEAVRDLVRDGIDRWQQENEIAEICVGNLSYVFDRRIRLLAKRLAEMQHASHDLIVSSTSVRLDHFYTMDSVLLKGATTAVRAFADQVRAERGVRSGAINLLRVDAHEHHEEVGLHVHEGQSHLSPTN
jgi:CopG family nickel-responsive transcriptional regulator